MRGADPSRSPAEGSLMRGADPSRSPAEGSLMRGADPSRSPAEGSARTRDRNQGFGHDVYEGGSLSVTRGARNSFGKVVRKILRSPGGPGTALHEYAHHLQSAMPGLQDLFRQEHLRRTTHPDGSRHPILQLDKYAQGTLGQRDDYIDGYFGRRYNWDRDNPLEVMTRAIESTLDKSFGKEQLHRLARDDPAMLDLVLGLLFHYDP